MFVRNAWYVGALATQLGRSLQAVRMLGENLVLYRREDGQPVALEADVALRASRPTQGDLFGRKLIDGPTPERATHNGDHTGVPRTTPMFRPPATEPGLAAHLAAQAASISDQITIEDFLRVQLLCQRSRVDNVDKQNGDLLALSG